VRSAAGDAVWAEELNSDLNLAAVQIVRCNGFPLGDRKGRAKGKKGWEELCHLW
jgi:hypothetical protein